MHIDIQCRARGPAVSDFSKSSRSGQPSHSAVEDTMRAGPLQSGNLQPSPHRTVFCILYFVQNATCCVSRGPRSKNSSITPSASQCDESGREPKSMTRMVTFRIRRECTRHAMPKPTIGRYVQCKYPSKQWLASPRTQAESSGRRLRDVRRSGTSSLDSRTKQLASLAPPYCTVTCRDGPSR